MTRPDLNRALSEDDIDTPAQVWNLDVLDDRLRTLGRFADQHDCQLFYSIKASAVWKVLQRIAPRVAGFSCSSPFEVQMAREALGADGTVSLTSPALSPGHLDIVNATCDHLSFNSLGQMRRMSSLLDPRIEKALRINPGLSIVDDPRYDPCRQSSKLGTPLSALVEAFGTDNKEFAGISGLQIHTACGNRSLKGLVETMALIEEALPKLLHQIRWFNLGGGYAFDKIRKTAAFKETTARLRETYDLEFIIEPGTAAVQNAAHVVTRVVDLFRSGSAEIAVLDTSVNHMPEVFAYQFQPPVRGARRDAEYKYILAGATCLAGDIFGSYGFDSPLEVGQRLMIEKAGAYTHGQSHWFNGVNLPTLYTYSKADGLFQERQFTYEDFAQRCGKDIKNR